MSSSVKSSLAIVETVFLTGAFSRILILINSGLPANINLQIFPISTFLIGLPLKSTRSLWNVFIRTHLPSFWSYCNVSNTSKSRSSLKSQFGFVPMLITSFSSKTFSAFDDETTIVIILSSCFKLSLFYLPKAWTKFLTDLSMFCSGETISFFSPNTGVSFSFTISNFSGCAYKNIIASSGAYFFVFLTF